MSQSPQQLADQIAKYELVSAGLWLVLGIIQCFAVITAIAGVWNIFAAYTRFKASFAIRRRDPSVPAAFEPVWPLVAIGAVNLLVGGVIGVVFVIVDLYVRSEILDNREVFEAKTEAAA